nr:MAG TPA: hypothetical protein [Caudoviricetes sp.]
MGGLLPRARLGLRSGLTNYNKGGCNCEKMVYF